MNKAKQEFLKANQRKGECYAGIILGKDGEHDYHLFLLPGEAESVNWEDAKTFASKASGELPTRREQSLLFANLKEEFKERAYWSNTPHAVYGSFAWCQGFDNGGQDDYYKDNELRARAVRRLVI